MQTEQRAQPMPAAQAVLGIGTNLGNREANLANAFDELERLPGTEVLKISNIYETEPFDVRSKQENYLNCCVLLKTGLPPEELLERCLAIETKLGRVRLEYHGARTMDIDLLLYEGFSSETERLTVPHPHIRERAFVMVPLADLFPTLSGLGFDFREACEAADKSGVALYK